MKFLNTKSFIVFSILILLLVGGFFLYTNIFDNMEDISVDTDSHLNNQTDNLLSWHSGDMFTGFDKIITYMKDQDPTVPVLLPKELVGIDQKNSYGGDLYASVGRENEMYSVNLYYGRNCSDDACLVVEFWSDASGTIDMASHLQRIDLLNGITGYYSPRKCLTACSPQYISWVYKGRTYTIALKLNNNKDDLIALVNSSIQNASDIGINKATTETVVTDPCAGRFDISPEKLRAGISAKTCEEATVVALDADCRAGSTIDLYPDSLVADLCNEEIAHSNISVALNAKLKKGLNDCQEKYKNQDGTLYLSLESSCELQVLQNITRELKTH